MTHTHAPGTVFVMIDRHVTGFDLTTPLSAIRASGWQVTVQPLDDHFAEPRCEHAGTPAERDALVRTITTELERAGRPVVVTQPRRPAAYHTPAMALRDYAPEPAR